MPTNSSLTLVATSIRTQPAVTLYSLWSNYENDWRADTGIPAFFSRNW